MRPDLDALVILAPPAVPTYAYLIRYETVPGTVVHLHDQPPPLSEISDIYDDQEALRRVETLVAEGDVPIGGAVVIWRAPYDEERDWRTWAWKRWRAYHRTPTGLRAIVPQFALAAQAYLD